MQSKILQLPKIDLHCHTKKIKDGDPEERNISTIFVVPIKTIPAPARSTVSRKNCCIALS